jgi:hypothetical protein
VIVDFTQRWTERRESRRPAGELIRPRCDDELHGEAEWGVADDDATPWCSECDTERSYGHWLHVDGGIDWVVCGAESGPGARPADPAWFRSLRDQCGTAGVAFFVKQLVVDGKLRKDLSEFPADLQIQEFPEAAP